MPRAAKYVLVEHTSGARKEVLRTTWLRGLGPHWKRVSTRKKSSPDEPAEPSHNPVEPADVPEANTKE